MTLQSHCDLAMAFARVLYVNGQSTKETVAAVGRLVRALGLRSEIVLRWGQVQLELQGRDGRIFSQVAADPTGVHMRRVAAAMSAIESVEAGRLSPNSALSVVTAIAKAPPTPTWLFALAAAVGAMALGVIFGAEHGAALGFILLSAAAGAVLRRTLALWSANVFVQPFCAALLAGAVGGLSVRYEVSSSLRLVAVCPCMVLVPGPHLLNSALDLVSGRIHLGAARLIYALLVLVAISMGLLLGLELLGASLPIDPAGKGVALWKDVSAAGVAVFAYSVFFSMPLGMLPWPIAIGMLAHALRWAALSVLGAGAATGALVACVVVGLILARVSHRRHLPFAAIGFASVVSMVPGVYFFRMISGLAQIAADAPTPPDLLGETVADGMTAVAIMVGMSLGLIVPKMLIDSLYDRHRRTTTSEVKERADLL